MSTQSSRTSSMTELVAGLTVCSRAVTARSMARRNRCSEKGEGVISLALAVLIMAALAAGMWVAYNRMWTNAAADTEKNIQLIGTGSGAAPAGGGADAPGGGAASGQP
jgi:hypothetical protein